MQKKKFRGKNKVQFKKTERKSGNFEKNIKKNFIKDTKNIFYRSKQPPRGAYYIITTGYSPQYAAQLKRQGIEANSYNTFSVVSELEEFTPAKVRNEMLSVLKEYEDNPDKLLENFGLGSDLNSQDTRIVDITVNLVY